MSQFKAVLLQHGYPSVEEEQRIITQGGGQFVDGDLIGAEEALRQAEDAEVILVRWLRITAEMLQRFRKCKILIRYGVGYDNVDVPAATQAGIIVGHIPQYCLDDVSTHALALWLGCVRFVTITHAKMSRGGWDINPPNKIWRTAGRTFGIVGLGNIGQQVARKLQGWNMRVLATDPFLDPSVAAGLNAQLVPLETLLAESDYISLHVPLLPETRHLINPRTISLMKPGSILINTARGPAVDGQALLEGLDSGRLAAAALDVFESEPPAADSPLRAHPRLILSDHVAWYSEESQTELRRTAAEEAVRVGRGGLPLAIANPEVLIRLGRVAEWTPSWNARWQLKRLERIKAQEIPKA